ncbi:MAG: DUF2520 domain-containing protein [Syntrophomonadaceae bacterium]|nr:DUF2520 domain-containing protein [Syntrophomonadaceae bacterium]
MKKIGIVGAGVVGTAVGVILASRGYEITGVYDIIPESTERLAAKVGARKCTALQQVSENAEILFITTNDSAIATVAEGLAKEGGFRNGQVVLHMSGALTSDILEPAKAFGALTVSVHPMQSFASEERAVSNLPGSVFTIEGDIESHQVASQLVKDLDGKYFVIDKKVKPIYHAGACVVSNYLVTVIDVGLQLMESIGIPRAQALPAIIPLVNGTVKNIERIGIPKALTGPIARGDISTVLKHLECLDELAPQLVLLYSWLGYYTAEVATAKGTVNEQVADNIKRLFLARMSQPIGKARG